MSNQIYGYTIEGMTSQEKEAKKQDEQAKKDAKKQDEQAKKDAQKQKEQEKKDAKKQKEQEKKDAKQAKKDAKKGVNVDNAPADATATRPTNLSSYFGTSYPYYQYIKTPAEMGMSDKGTMSALGKDISGLMNYVDLLVSGKSKASMTGKPLGNKYFMKTGASCNADDTGEVVDRYIYINNIPSGNIPFVSTGLGAGNFKDFKGLVPGVVSNLNAFNPAAIMNSFSADTYPKCQKITMETVDVNNGRYTESNYVTMTDIESMDPCSFPNKTNPITGKKCKEGFSQYESSTSSHSLLDSLYFSSLGIFSIFVLHQLVSK